MKYYSEKTKDFYDKVEELETAEKKFNEKEKKNQELKNARQARAKEVENAYAKVTEDRKVADELMQKFCDDYGSFHTTIHNDDLVHSIWADVLNSFPFII